MLFLTTSLCVLGLLVKLLSDRVVLPLDLLGLRLQHLRDSLLGLFWAVVRFVVKLVFLEIICLLLLVPVDLGHNEVLVLLLVGTPFQLSLSDLRLLKFDVMNELRLLCFP